MIVNLDLNTKTCKITKETGDKRYTKSGYTCDMESAFLYSVLQSLKQQGFDVIKKRAWKDGNLVDDYLQWIRTRKWNNDIDGKQFAIYNSQYALYDAGEKFNGLKIGESLFLTVYQ